MSNEVVLWKLFQEDGSEIPIKTRFVERTIPVPTKVNIPLYENGALISDEKLAEIGLNRVGYTQDQLDEVHYARLYEMNPDLAVRVRQYKAYLDELGVAYAASMDDIVAAITISAIEDKAAYGTSLKATYDAIITNLEACGSVTPHMDAYLQLAKLIQYLPEE